MLSVISPNLNHASSLARARRSWSVYSSKVQALLRHIFTIFSVFVSTNEPPSSTCNDISMLHRISEAAAGVVRRLEDGMNGHNCLSPNIIFAKSSISLQCAIPLFQTINCSCSDWSVQQVVYLYCTTPSRTLRFSRLPLQSLTPSFHRSQVLWSKHFLG